MLHVTIHWTFSWFSINLIRLYHLLGPKPQIPAKESHPAKWAWPPSEGCYDTLKELCSSRTDTVFTFLILLTACQTWVRPLGAWPGLPTPTTSSSLFSFSASHTLILLSDRLGPLCFSCSLTSHKSTSSLALGTPHSADILPCCSDHPSCWLLWNETGQPAYMVLLLSFKQQCWFFFSSVFLPLLSFLPPRMSSLLL